MPQQNKSLRKELLEARERILRQIDICANDPNFKAGNAVEPPAGAVPDLMAELKQIEHALNILPTETLLAAIPMKKKKKNGTIRRYVSYAAIAVVALIVIRWVFKEMLEISGILPQEELVAHWIFYLIALGGAVALAK